jgi:hypothetical protein
MDIYGAKALRLRLGPKGTDEAPPLRADVDVAEDAPPVYRWLGVRHQATDAPREVDDDPATPV